MELLLISRRLSCNLIFAIVIVMAMGTAVGNGAVAKPIDCTSYVYSDDNADALGPCIFDVKLAFARKPPDGSIVGNMFDPRDPSDPSRKAHLWAWDGDTILFTTWISFYIGGPNAPESQAKSPLQYQAAICDHDAFDRDERVSNLLITDPSDPEGGVFEYVAIPTRATLTRCDGILDHVCTDLGAGKPPLEIEDDKTIEVYAPPSISYMNPSNTGLPYSKARETTASGPAPLRCSI